MIDPISLVGAGLNLITGSSSSGSNPLPAILRVASKLPVVGGIVSAGMNFIGGLFGGLFGGGSKPKPPEAPWLMMNSNAIEKVATKAISDFIY